MRKILYHLIALLVASVVLVACGGGGGGSDDAAKAGEALFAQTVIGSQPGCKTCHSLDPGVVIVGPSLAGLGSKDNADTIRESILDPNAVLEEGFPADTMPAVWADELSSEQIDQLVAYLVTLK